MRRTSPGGWVAFGACGLALACSLQDFDYLRDESVLNADAGLGGASGTSGNGGASSGTQGDQGGNSGAAGFGGTGGAAGASGSGSGGASGSGTGGASSGTGGAGGSGGSGASGGVGGAAGFVGSLGDAGPDTNIVQDPGFESGVTGWGGFGSAVIIWETSGPLAGSHCLHVTQREFSWNGPSYSLLSTYTPGATYRMSTWLRSESPVTGFQVTVRYTCNGGTINFNAFLPSQTAHNYWSFYEGTFVAPDAECAATNVDIYIENAPAGEDLYLDEFRVELESP